MHRDLQKYPCFYGFEWCTLRIFFKLRLPCFLRLPWTNSFQGGQSCTLYTPTFGFSYPLEALSLCNPRWALRKICTLCWDVLRLVSIVATCYSLYPLLVRATSCTHCWYVLQVVPITRICLQPAPIIRMCYSLYPLLVRATGCTHCWYVLQVVAITGICLQSARIIGTCYGLYP